MNICIPVNEDQGLQSTVCAHFGAAPLFLIVESDQGTCRAIVNQNQHHGHGQCSPLSSLTGEAFDAMVVGGIGMGALNKLGAAGVTVYLSDHPTVAETVAAMKAGTLQPVQPGQACAHHGHDHGHGHGHGHGPHHGI